MVEEKKGDRRGEERSSEDEGGGGEERTEAGKRLNMAKGREEVGRRHVEQVKGKTGRERLETVQASLIFCMFTCLHTCVGENQLLFILRSLGIRIMEQRFFCFHLFIKHMTAFIRWLCSPTQAHAHKLVHLHTHTHTHRGKHHKQSTFYYKMNTI